jgi:tetratricopeptide (TPR) repeat protein
MNDYVALMQQLALDAVLAGNHAQAETLLRPCIGATLDPGYALYLLGHIQYHMQRYEEAAVALSLSVAITPDQAAAQNDLAAALFALGRETEAVPAIERALAARPDLAEAQETWSIELLRAGRLREAWPQYEARFHSAQGLARRRDFSQPQWRGETPIAGRTILLHAEQGAGDTFQFVRYVPMVAALGATVVLEVYPGLRDAMAGLDGATTVIERGEALPAFDLHCPLLSLPLAFGTDLDSIPAEAPYLAARPDRVALWRTRLGARRGRRIGVVFSGNPGHPDDARRSIPLVQFARLLPDAPDRSFHILQPAIREADRFALELLPHVHDHSAMLDDFADTAALITLMDVVVSVDTSVAHLAGALGWPVWVLLPAKPDWRWLMQRDDSPWYPTMWLFRQQRPGDWESVLDAAARRLEELLA